MNTKILFATASAFLALNASAFGSPAVPVIGQASHLDYTLQDNSTGGTQTAQQRQQEYLKRMELIGRTVRYDEVAPAPVSQDKPAVTYAERVQQHEQRMKLVGRTAQPGEVADDTGFDSQRNGSRFSAKRTNVMRSTQ